MLAGYDKVYAAAFVNRNHQPQRLYEIPWQDGVLVVQPRHHLALNPYRPWRLMMRDERVDALYLVHGYFANEPLAEQYCRNVFRVGGGIRLDPTRDRDTGFSHLIEESIEKAEQQFRQNRPTELVAKDSWMTGAIPDDATRYCAFRQVLTTMGTRVEFFPPPPSGVSDTAKLKRMLKPQLDPHLDARQLDQPMDGLPDVFRQAWHAQAAPWTLVEVAPDCWTSAQVGQDGRVLQWTPAPPNTAAAERVLESLRPLLPPRAPDPPPAENPELATQWRTAVFNEQANGVRLAQVGWDHPLVAALPLTPKSPAAWGVVPHPAQPGHALAVRIQPMGDHIELHGLLDPVHPEQLWVASPDVMEATIRRVWAREPVRYNLPISVSVTEPSRSGITPTLSPSPARRGISF